MLLTNPPTRWKRCDSGTPVRFFQFSRKLSELYFFRPMYIFTLFILSYPVTYRVCFRLYFALVRTPPVARLVNVQFANVEKSSRSCYFLKFLRKFSQIIILTSPILRSTLSPWLMLSLFSFSLICSIFWILSLKSHSTRFLITLQCCTLHYIKYDREKSTVSAVFFL